MTEQGSAIPYALRDEETVCFISDDLRTLVVQLLNDSPTPARAQARRDLYARATREDPYLIASSVYDFLWKRVTVEKRRPLYPVVGDFFLTALEKTLGRIGPNNMGSRYRELLECYSGTGEIRHAIEGPLYCADLFLLKVSQLVLSAHGDTQESRPDSSSSSSLNADFLVDEQLSLEDRIAHSLDMARDALTDAQQTLIKATKDGVTLPTNYGAFIRSTLDRLTLSWQGWKEIHGRKDIATLSVEEYFRQGIRHAEKINSLVLAAMLLEQAGEEYQDMMCREFLQHRFSSKALDHPRRGCTFDAGEIYRDQGLAERQHGAYILSERRFSRAIALFTRLNDRTSVAQTLIERARVYMLQDSQIWRARGDLIGAVQMIAAVQQRAPAKAALPRLTTEQIVTFYKQKGLAREAELCMDDPADG